MTYAKRPKWAKALSAADWRHLREGQDRAVRELRLDAANGHCQDCVRILERIQRPS